MNQLMAGYKQPIGDGDMALVRSRPSLDALKEAYREGDADKDLRSYYIPRYQQRMIDILAEDSGLSKGGVIREIINEWYNLKVQSVESGLE